MSKIIWTTGIQGFFGIYFSDSGRVYIGKADGISEEKDIISIKEKGAKITKETALEIAKHFELFEDEEELKKRVRKKVIKEVEKELTGTGQIGYDFLESL